MVKQYESFRYYLEQDFAKMDITSKQQLKSLMRLGGYRTKIIKGDVHKITPTDKQLDVAWGILRKFTIQRYFTVKNEGRPYPKDKVHTEKYKRREIIRANRNLIIDGKKYRKGQFIPKRRKR